MVQGVDNKNKTAKTKPRGNKLRKLIMWIACVVFSIVIIVPCLLYIPFVQSGVKNAASYLVNTNTNMKMDIGRIMLKFPLKLSVDDVLILDEKSDTMLYAKNMGLDVNVLPILHNKVEIRSVSLNKAIYKMSAVDSAMVLRAEINRFGLRRSDVDLDKNEVNLRNISLKGCKVGMVMRETTQTDEPADTTVIPWKLNIDKVKIENLEYNMQMLPLIESLKAKVGDAIMERGVVNLATNDVKIGYFGVNNADVKYLYPIISETNANVAVNADNVQSAKEWTITADSLRLNNSEVVYAMSGILPNGKGLDVNYLNLTDVNVSIDSIYNRGAAIKLDLTRLEARERSGLEVKSGQGRFAIDDKLMSAVDVKLETAHSQMKMDAIVSADITTNENAVVKVDAEAKLGMGDVTTLYPSLSTIINKMPRNVPVDMVLNIDGNTRRIDVKDARLGIGQYLIVKADGYAENVMNAREMSAKVDFSGDFNNLNFVKEIALEDSVMQSQIDIPDMTLKGKAVYAKNVAKGKLDMRLSNGEMVFDGDWNGYKDSYNVSLKLDSFPMQSILPYAQMKHITADTKVSGVGYDPFSELTRIDASVNVDKVVFGKKMYRYVTASACVAERIANIVFKSSNTDCDMNVSMSCLLDTAVYEFAANGVINNVDLKALNLSETVSSGKCEVEMYGTADLNNNIYDVDLLLENFKWQLPDVTYSSPRLSTTFETTPESISVSAKETDMAFDFTAACGMDTLLARLEKTMKIVEHEISIKRLDVDTLQHALPHFSCDVKVGEKNIIKQALKAYDVKMEKMSLNMVNDSTIYMNGEILGVESGTMRLDTVTMFANQRNKYLTYKLHVGNREGTNDDFAQVTLRGGVRGNMLGMLLEQYNIKGEEGFHVGVNALLSDTAVNVNLYPRNPIIGYRKWNVNDGNSVNYNYINGKFEADLNLKCDSSFLVLRTEKKEGHIGQDDVKLSLGGVQISEWLKVSPFIPPMSGELSADMRLVLDRKNILGGGITRLKDFKFNKKRVGDFAFKLGLELDPHKEYVRLISSFDVNGRKTITARGALNDTTSNNPYNITVSVDSMPMDVINPFVPADMARLEGALNGSMNLTGSFTEPVINGYLQGYHAKISLPLFGSNLRLSDDKIPVENSVVHFDKYEIFGSNNNAIAVDGYVNMKPLDDMKMDLTMKGTNVEFVNSKQQRKMELFGKGYATIDASVRGSMNDMNVNASLSLLPATNLVYVMQTDVSTLSTQTDESMVKFVNFADTVKEEVDSITNIQLRKSNFKLNAKLNIQQGSKFSVYLSNSGNDRLELSGNGILNYTQSSLGDMRLVGQYTIKDGFVRYTPPLLSEKYFEFTEGSYISWTGDVLNPILNIKATDQIKANVQQQGQDSRVINFVVTVDVGNTLNNMNLNFDLSTNEDVTVQNELLTMSPIQRSSQAMNMLLYGTYTGQGTTANTSGNPLYSFLNSQINRWAANTIKGVDLSFGVNQYDKTSGDEKSKSTTYSYKISKSLFNDRFKIVVGGNYNPSAGSEENFASSLLNDISFVYMLNQSGTMQVKVFRHSGYESVLEGEVIETGAAFVIKRKLTTLKNLFRFGGRKTQPSNGERKELEVTEKSPMIEQKENEK